MEEPALGMNFERVPALLFQQTAWRTWLSALVITLVSAMPARAAVDAPYILVDAASGAVLAERNAGELWYPASLTKLMTAYLTFRAMAEGRLVPGSPVIISANAHGEPPSKMGLAVGTVLRLDDALKMLLIKSANDIAVALGETVAGSEARFVAAMNAQAQRLGLAGTRFVNANGLPAPGQVTTARDLAVLARAIWREFPERRPLFAIGAIQSGREIMRSQNELLARYSGADGMKTGFICASGYNMVATATRGGRTLIAVVLGETSSRSRAQAAATLLDRGFAAAPAVGGPSVETLRPPPTAPAPVNMRPVVCPSGGVGAENAGLTAEFLLGPSGLGPQIALVQPVEVFTAADPRGRIAVGVPLPRRKPAASAAGAFAAYAAEPPPAFRRGPALPATAPATAGTARRAPAAAPLDLMPVPRPRP